VGVFGKSERGNLKNGDRCKGVIPNNGSLKFGVARGKEEDPFSTVSGHVQFDLVKFSIFRKNKNARMESKRFIE
jgi:hypothetical protein